MFWALGVNYIHKRVVWFRPIFWKIIAMILVNFRPFKNYAFFCTFFIIDKKTGQISGPRADKITGGGLWDSFCALGVEFWLLLVHCGHLQVYFFPQEVDIGSLRSISSLWKLIFGQWKANSGLGTLRGLILQSRVLLKNLPSASHCFKHQF